MNRLIQSGVLFLVMLGVSIGAWAQSAADIIALDNARYDSMIAKDWDKFDKLLGEEFVYFTATSKKFTKKEYADYLKSGTATVRKATLANVKVNFYGDTAVSMGDTKVEVTLEGKDRVIDLMYTHVWVKRDGRWQLVARQSTFFPAPAK